MPAATTEYGPVREIWLAPVNAAASKKSFLVRDDAYASQGAVFGRTLRLGEPVNLGPNSTWRQKTWEGGRDQTVWNDEAMYSKGTADTSTKAGKIRMWPGYEKIAASPNRKFIRYVMMRSPESAMQGNVGLFFAEYDQLGFRAPADASVYFYNASTGAVSTTRNVAGAGSVAALGAVFDAATNNFDALTVCFTNGRVDVRDSVGSWVSELPALGAGCGSNGIVNFNGQTYLARNRQIWKRTYNGTTVAWSKIHDIYGAPWVRSLVVWNNRLWFIGVHPGNRTVLYISDGATVVEAFTMPDDFHGMHLAVHYGSLYIAGHTSSSATGNGIIGQIWRYNGASLTRLYQVGDDISTEEHYMFEMATLGKYLAWGRHGGTSTGRRPGLMLYDAELDAIVDGPTLDMAASSNQNWITGIIAYGGQWAISLYDTKQYSGAYDGPVSLLRVRQPDRPRHKMSGGTSLGGNSVEAQPSTAEQFVLSSVFDGELPGEAKTWLTGRARVKLPTNNTQVLVKVLLDESTTETTVATINFASGQTDYRTVVFPLKDGSGNYLKSTTIQYKLYLRNTESGNVDSTANPYVDTVEVEYMPAPTKRRQWQLRALASDGQKRLDGTANPLTTTTAIVSELETLWGNAAPLLFWDADASGGTPAGAGTEVVVSTFQKAQYRVDSDNDTENAEVGLTLIEVVST